MSLNVNRGSVVLLLALVFSFFTHSANAVIRDGGVDPANLGKGGWLLDVQDATNKLGGNVPSVHDEDSLFAYMKSQGLSYVIVKAATSNTVYTSHGEPMFTSNLVQHAHAQGLFIFGSNRSWGNDIQGEILMTDYVFNQGADGFIWDAEAEWESNRSWIGTNGPALAWQLCSAVRSNWPTKFLAHNPIDIVYSHSSFPFKEFGYWSDCTMPQVYRAHTASRGNAVAAIEWADVNWATWQKSLYSLPPSTINGQTIYWTNAIKPLVYMRDVYEGTYPDFDVALFNDYCAADPNFPGIGGMQGSDYFRSELHDAGQWAYIKEATFGTFSNVVNNIILDDAAASRTGSWQLIKTISSTTSGPSFSGAVGTDTNSFGTNYWTATRGTGSNQMKYFPVVRMGGDYKVYQWHPTRANASASVPVRVNGYNLTTVQVNQQTNGGNWSLIGQFKFQLGATNSITFSDNFPEASAIAMVDGLKMVYVPPTSLPIAPGALTATPVDTSTINLSWTYTGTNHGGFVVSRSTTSGGPYVDLAVLNYNTTFTDTGLDPFTTYYYVVRAVNGLGSSPNSPEALATTFNFPPAPPSILVQPQGNTLSTGSSATFSVGATGYRPLSYQWYFNGAPVAGETNSSFTKLNIQAADDGTYYVVVSNPFGSTTSSSVSLHVLVSLTATSSVQGGTITTDASGPYALGQLVTITAVAPSNYVFVGWTGDLYGQTNPVTIPMNNDKQVTAYFQPADDDIIVDNPDALYNGIWTLDTGPSDIYGTYYQYALTTNGTTTSTAKYQPSITKAGKYSVYMWSPSGVSRSSNAVVTVSYQGGSISTHINQKTNNGSWQLLATAKPFVAGTVGYAQIGNNTGETNAVVVADAMRFQLITPPSIVAVQYSNSVLSTTATTLSVVAGGTRPLSFQWLLNGTNISNATNDYITINPLTLFNSGTYSVRVTNAAGSVLSSNLVMNVTPAHPLVNSGGSDSGVFHFVVNGDPGNYVIDVSSNLVNWTTVTNFTLTTNSFIYTDTVAAGQKFYRSRYVP